MSAIAAIMSVTDQTEKFQRAIKRMKHRGEERIIDYQSGNQRLMAAEFARGGMNRISATDAVATPFLLFSGKLFKTGQLRESIKGMNTRDLTEDPSLILALYEEQGEAFLHELEGSYAFALYDPEKGWLIARDSLGRMPLYLSASKDKFCFASDMKGIRELTTDFIEFPPGHFYSSDKGFAKVEKPNKNFLPLNRETNLQEEIRHLLLQSTESMIRGEESVGVYLSGGLDSSIVAALSSRLRTGLQTFSVGVKGSPDLKHARICSDFIGSSHQEYTYTKEEMLDVLPEVIWHLESYDAGLVRSSIANYFLARISSEHIETALSGEGADELFLGYDYLAKLSPEQLEGESERMLSSLHNTGLQRGDRMSAAFGIQALTPFLDESMIRIALQIPVTERQMPGKSEKWMLKDAFQGWIPDEVQNRKKNKFSVGAGSSRIISQVADEKITDKEWEQDRFSISGHPLISKEELMYYRIFREFFPELACDRAVGHTSHL